MGKGDFCFGRENWDLGDYFREKRVPSPSTGVLSLPKGKPRFTHHLGLTCLTACNFFGKFSLRTIKFCPLKIEKYLLCLFVKTGPILLIPQLGNQAGRAGFMVPYPSRLPIGTRIERATSRGDASGICK